MFPYKLIRQLLFVLKRRYLGHDQSHLCKVHPELHEHIVALMGHQACIEFSKDCICPLLSCH